MTGSRPDLGVWVDFVAEALRAPEVDGSYVDVLRLLSDTFEALVAWQWLEDDGTMGFRAVGAPSGWPPDGAVEEWVEHQAEHPLVRWFGTTRDLEPMTMGRVPAAVVDRRDVSSARALLASPDVTEQLAVPVRLGLRQHGTFVLSRGGGDFTDEQLRLACQLQPLLMLLERQRSAEAQRSCGAGLAREHGLTGRESAVLALLAQGLTATAIGGRLGCSARTVEKHVEHMYRKLGVRDRLSAIRCAEAHQRGAQGGSSAPAAGPGVLQFSGRLPSPRQPLFPSRVAS
jgi:DNA-binding CsgD family transcriptional regulator